MIYGHRISIDLDFFTDHPFDKLLLIEALEEAFTSVVVIENRSKAIMQCSIRNVKVDFVAVKDPFNKEVTYIESVPFAHIEDIAALKLNAIKGRGSKKDFWDIARLLDSYDLGELLSFYSTRYPYDDSFSVVRSLVYFEDAENDPDPVMLEKTSWEMVKKKIEKAFKNYYKKN